MDLSKISTGVVCQDCTILIANGDLPDLPDNELADYVARIEREENSNVSVTLGHTHEIGSNDCYHAGTDCEDDCDCEYVEFSSTRCGYCETTLAGYRHDVTFLFD